VKHVDGSNTVTATQTWIIACALLGSCSNGADHKPEQSMAAGSNAADDSMTNAANGSASSSSAGSGGSTSVAANSGSGGTHGNAGDGGGSAMTSAGSGGSNVQSPDAGVRHDAGTASDAAITNPASCPTSYAELSAAPSPCATNVGCTYPEGYCTCVGRCSGVAPNPSDPPVVAVWSCKRPPEGCPPGVPAVGTECGEEGRTCYYGGCCIQLVTCRSSGWFVGLPMCPP
jgi:hypothetical protein